VTEIVTVPEAGAAGPATAGRRRTARALRSSVALGAGSATGFLVSLATVPLTIDHLGVERFGLLVAVLAGAALLEPLDLGVGSALLTRLARAEAAGGPPEEPAALVSAALRVMVGMAVAVAVLTAVAWRVVDWRWVLTVEGPAAGGEVGPAMTVMLALFCVGLPLGLVDRVHLGLERGDRTGATLVAGHLLALTGIAGASTVEASVPVLVCAAMGGPLAARAVAAWLLLARLRPDLWRPASPIPPSLWGPLGRHACLFFGLQAANAVAFTSDQLIIANILGTAAVSEYSVPARVFTLVSLGAAVLARPLWPAYAAAAAAGDDRWIRRTLARSAAAALGGSAVLAASLAATGPWWFPLLSRGLVHPSTGVIAGLAVWTVLAAVGHVVAAALNGLSVIRLQLLASCAMAVSNVVLSVVLVHRIGVAGVIWGSVISYSACIAVPYLWLVPRLLRSRVGAR
jgi:O-antigen/teichoic acid export membrane protein